MSLADGTATVAEAVLAWLRDREDEMCDLLGRLARAESPSLIPESQTAMFELLADPLRELGFAVRAVGGRRVGAHLYARPADVDPGLPRQLLVGHMDTVWPAGTLDTMPVHVTDGCLFGPGVYDMKGGLVQMLFALSALRALALEPAATPLVLVTTDEEIGSPDSADYLRLLARASARAFVLEPPFGPVGRLKTARKGAGRFLVTVRGRAAHAGSAPDEGVSAILELTHQVQRLFALNDPARGVTVNVGTIDGGLRTNIVAPVATASADVRAVTVRDAQRLEHSIRALRPVAPGSTIEVSGGWARPPMEATAGNRALCRTALGLARQVGLELEEAPVVGGASDGNITSPFTATLDGLGSLGDGAHAAAEHVVVSALAERTALLALLLLAPVVDA